MMKKTTILEIGGEGGSVELYMSNGQYIIQSNDTGSLSMLDEEDRQDFEDIFKPEIFDSFDEAFERFLDKYPVFHLYPEKIDPAYMNRIKKYYTEYLETTQYLHERSKEAWDKMFENK
jgi:hypothetical protein